MLTNSQIAEKGRELIGCLQMFEINKHDAAQIAAFMVREIANIKYWTNPLAGSGFKAATASDTTVGHISPPDKSSSATRPVLSPVHRQRVFHEPIDSAELN